MGAHVDGRDRVGARRRIPPAVVLGAAHLAGSIPFSNLMSRARTGVDLRDVGTGTVSGTGLYDQAGFAPLAVAGVAEVAKGAVGPLLAGRDRPVLAALAGGLAVCGHNWSVFLRGAGGRGISPAIGALAAANWPGSAVLLAGLAAGRLTGQTAVGSAVADLALVPVLARVRGRAGALAGAAVLAPMIAKRLLGNGPAPRGEPRTYAARLLFDRDTWDEPA